MKLPEFKKIIDDAAKFLNLPDEDIDIKIGGPDYDFFDILSAYPNKYKNHAHIIIEPGDYYHANELCADCGENINDHYKNGANGCPCTFHKNIITPEKENNNGS
jgi:hypothetical protein